MRRQLLSGLLVVSLEQAVAAPFAAAKLAAGGARVIKVERAGGDFARRYDEVVDGQSAYFVWLNRGKESVVLDIQDPDDGALLRRLIGRADIFIQNLAPGAAARAGFGSDALRERHPRLITCDISGYGEEGKFSRMKAYDNLVQGETGLLSVTGTPESPARVGFSVADISAGMHAYAGILEALLHRQQSGEGSGVRVSLFDCLAEWMSVPYLHQVYGGSAPPRTGAHHPSIAPYGPYRAGDGGEVLISIQNEREWTRFAAGVLGDPELATRPAFATNPARVRHRPELDAAIHAALAGMTRGELVERLMDAGIAFGRINSVAELAAHPQLRRDAVDWTGGTAELPADPIRRSGGGDPPRHVPAPGEQTVAIRAAFGSDTAEDA